MFSVVRDVDDSCTLSMLLVVDRNVVARGLVIE